MSLAYDFSGRTVIVTGAAQGIGAAVADLFVAAGAEVAVIDRNSDELSARWGSVNGVTPITTDVAESSDVDATVETLISQWGHIDVVVNNAGITRDGFSWKLSDEQWNAVLGVHLTGTFNFTRAALPHMRRNGFGRFINVTSFTGMHGNLGQANYAAAKAGIIGFTKSVAKETARFGITSNAISPNASTAMVASVPADRLTEITAMIPMGRFADAAEVAHAVGFLASDEAGYVTGVVLPIDGGAAM